MAVFAGSFVAVGALGRDAASQKREQTTTFLLLRGGSGRARLNAGRCVCRLSISTSAVA